MFANLTWTKGTFSGLYQIYKDGEPVGTLKDKTFSRTAEGEINGKTYRFETRGFLKQNTVIIDAASGGEIGSITYNNWMTKAVISVSGKTANWQYDNTWNTKWSLSDPEGNRISYKGSSTKGSITSNADDSLLLLSGLFVTHYYWQMTILVLIIALMPVWITAIN